MIAKLDYGSMRNHALMLVAAFRRLKEERPRVDGKRGVEVPAAAAQIVGALAVEIGFKAIVAEDRGIIDPGTLKQLFQFNEGHKLSGLFGFLPDKVQSEIRNGYSDWASERRTIVQMTNLVGLDDLEEIIRAKGFDEELALASNTFVEWRYSYEHNILATNTTFVEYLVEKVASLFGADGDLHFPRPPTIHKKMG